MRPPFLHLPTPKRSSKPPFVALNRRVEAALAQLRAAERPWVLAASGGVDSSAAMLLLARAQTPCLVVHVQHHLRADAHRDQEVVQRQAEALGLPCYVVHLPRPPKGDTENRSARSRRLRYDALATIAQQAKGQLLTAHHTEDLLETFLLRVQRGTGLAQAFGLQATMTWRDQTIHRPLLAFWKSELRQLVEAAEFPWIEDSSNRSYVYARNALRQALAPLVTHLDGDPRFAQTLVALAHEATQLREEMKQLPSLHTLFEPPPSTVAASSGGKWLARAQMHEHFHNAYALRQSLYQWCRTEGYSVPRDVLTDVSTWSWNGQRAARDAQGLHFQCEAEGLYISANDAPPRPRPEPDFVPLSSDWTSIGALRLRIDGPQSGTTLFARPLLPGDRFPSPHSGRLVGVRKRLVRDGISAELRAQAVVLAFAAPSAPKSLECNASSDQKGATHPSPTETCAQAPHADVIAGHAHTLSGNHPPHGPHRIVGVVYAGGQRVELTNAQGVQMRVVSDGSKPSDD